jgi:hypothetical protein
MDEEIAFYDALAEDESARQVIGRTSIAGYRARIGGEHQEQCLGGLDAPGCGACPDAGSGEAVCFANTATRPTCSANAPVLSVSLW